MKPRLSVVWSGLKFLKWHQHCFLLDIFSYDTVIEIPIEILQTLLFCPSLACQWPWACCTQRVKANYHLGVRHGVSLETQYLQWELLPQQIVHCAKVPRIKQAILSQQCHFISTAILLILLIETKFSPLSFHEFILIGKCLEEIGGPDLSHVLLLLSISEKVASFPQPKFIFFFFWILILGEGPKKTHHVT